MSVLSYSRPSFIRPVTPWQTNGRAAVASVELAYPPCRARQVFLLVGLHPDTLAPLTNLSPERSLRSHHHYEHLS